MHDPMLMNENISYPPQQASGNRPDVGGRGMMMGYQ